MIRYTSSIIIAVAIFAFSEVSHGEPDVTSVVGETSHGNQLVISGSAFGTRGDYNNTGASWRGNRFLSFRVKDFDDDSLSSGGFNSPNASWRTTVGGRSGSGFFATKFYNGQRLGALEARQVNTTGTWYLSFWLMMPANTSSSKPFRIYGSGSAGNLYLASGGAGNSSFSLRGVTECSAPECSSETVWSSPDQLTPQRWHRVEIKLSQSKNGSISVYLDGNLQWTRDRWLAITPGVYDRHTIDLGNLINKATNGDNSPENASYNFDDVYFDFTDARVELGNAPSWDASTLREVQVPITWSDTSLTIAVNQGPFRNGDSAYLYVFDENGIVNQSGYPITIGGDGITQNVVAPASPSELIAD